MKVVRVVPVFMMRLEGWKNQILKVSDFSGCWGFYLGPYPVQRLQAMERQSQFAVSDKPF